MCGIAGILGVAPDAAVLERMAQAMVHRGPDGCGLWHDGEQAGLSFRRLAIIDLDERSNQPLHFDHLHLVFNGEIYNYIELREELRALGHSFHTEGDAEVLLHAWHEWDEGALNRFNGMFALAIWDERRRRATLCTDPFAEKPLFYSVSAGRLLFASDVRALRVADDTVGGVDESAIRSFLAFDAMPLLPRTFFAEVKRLPPAHLARWERGELSLRHYWSPRRIAVPSEPAEAAERLRALLLDSVRLRLRSDVPIGTSLSGGVDSSAVVVACSRLAGEHTRHAFTATFPGFARDEWGYAQEAATVAGVVEHHAVRPSVNDLLDDLDGLVEAQEEPFGSLSIYAQWRVMRAAREAGVIVLLDGQGADELFAGYPGTVGWALRALGLRSVLRAVLADRTLVGGVITAYTAGRVPRALTSHYHSRRASPYLARELTYPEQVSEPTRRSGFSPLHQELQTQTFATSLPNLCRFADRNSMAHSLEVRLPFLDRRIAEFAFSLPASITFRGHVQKRVLRDAMRGLVPERILDRREKVGYETPEQTWLNTPAMRARIGEVVLDPSVLNSGRYDQRALVREFAGSSWSDVRALWRIINVELWARSPRVSASATSALSA